MASQTEIYINTLIRWVTVKLAPSSIHGVGVFAIRDIKEGERLFTDIQGEIFYLPYKKLLNNTPAYVHDTIVERWPLVKKDSAFVYPDVRFLAYMNHSDNANYDAVNDVAMRDIKEGEEITEDYRKIDGWEELYPFIKK